jgi:hypothetical protein
MRCKMLGDHMSIDLPEQSILTGAPSCSSPSETILGVPFAVGERHASMPDWVTLPKVRSEVRPGRDWQASTRERCEVDEAARGRRRSCA